MWLSGSLGVVFMSLWSPSEGTYFVKVFLEVDKVSHGFSEPQLFWPSHIFPIPTTAEVLRCFQVKSIGRFLLYGSLAAEGSQRAKPCTPL